MNFLPYGEVVTGSIPLSANQFSVVRYRWSGRPLAMNLHIANKMDEVEASVWWDLSRIVRYFKRNEINRKNAKRAVLSAALRLVNDES